MHVYDLYVHINKHIHIKIILGKIKCTNDIELQLVYWYLSYNNR